MIESRGSILVSRLAVHYPERFKAYSFVAVGYSPTSSGLDLETGMRMVEQVVGYVTLGYWEYVLLSHLLAVCLRGTHPQAQALLRRRRG